ncbi:unnamed protein product, partial [Mycena citricolor]
LRLGVVEEMLQGSYECGDGGSSNNIHDIMRALMPHRLCRTGSFDRHTRPVRLRVSVEVPATATAAASHVLLLAFAFVARSDCLKIGNMFGEIEGLQTDERDQRVFSVVGRKRAWADSRCDRWHAQVHLLGEYRCLR